MATQAIDVTTIFHALHTLENAYLGADRKWGTKNQNQIVVFELYRQYKGMLSALANLKAKASTDWEELNRFLTDSGFDPMFNGPLEGIGVVSILDMLIEWLKQAALCEIYGRDNRTHAGFEIPQGGHTVFTVEGSQVASLLTKSGDKLWLTMPNTTPTSPMDLIRIAFTTMSKGHSRVGNISTVQVPEVDFNMKPDISFLVGADTHDESDQYWYISEAYQQFMLRINKEGARVKVATGMAMRKGIDLDEPRPLVFNRPFIGWFTQVSAPRLPIAIFYADYDCWKKAGNLREM